MEHTSQWHLCFFSTVLLTGTLLLAVSDGGRTQDLPRPRARDLGVVIGVLRPGVYNAITDVAGVRVGQVTVVEGDSVNTGVTAVLPHGGNIFRDRVPAGLYVFNGFGKFVGASQLREHGELETPIVLTCTLCVWKAADALAEWMLKQAGMEAVLSVNPVVGETNDGEASDIRRRPIKSEDVHRALDVASTGPVTEGSVGAGAGTKAFGWKGGVGTSSRVLPRRFGGYTVGVLVQSNFGGMLTVNGAPVGRELGQYSFQPELEGTNTSSDDGKGSIVIVVATDAPLSASNLERLAKRAMLGLARTGGFGSGTSGDFVIAFSTASSVRRKRADAFESGGEIAISELPYNGMSPLFEAVVEATEEAILNSVFKAKTITYRGHKIPALPIPETSVILKRYDVLNWDRRLRPFAK